MSAMPLRLYDVPELAIGAGEDTYIRRLPAALGEDDGVMQDDFEERGCWGRSGLLLLALAAVRRNGGGLGHLAGNHLCRQLAKEGITC